MIARIAIGAVVVLALVALPLLLPVERLAGPSDDDAAVPAQLCAIASLYAGPTARVARLHMEGGSRDTAAALVGRIRRLERICGPALELPANFDRLEQGLSHGPR